MRRLLALIFTTIVLVACSGGADRAVDETAPPTSTPTPTAEATPDLAPTGMATATPRSTVVAAGPTPRPSSPRVGIAGVDALVAAIVAADAAHVRGALEYVQVPCQGPANPIPGPGCPAGIPIGTLIDAFPRAGCEFTFEPVVAISPVVTGLARPGLTLFAVYETKAGRGRLVPIGDYVLVFATSDSQFDAVRVTSDGGVVHWVSSCGRVPSADFLAELPIGAPVLAPRLEEVDPSGGIEKKPSSRA